ncbi:MAG: MoaD/ThiS family protein [Planctomycetes bacterium]|nr:MoaD/ThiS family protein [Planctomycetota bacterium]
MVTVEFTRHLYTFFPDLDGRRIEVSGETVAQVIRGMEQIAPGLEFCVCDEHGRLRQHVNIFVGDEPVSDRGTLSDAVAPGSRVLILQALSGG